MYSWNCGGCNKPILSKDVVNKTNKWMSWVVVIDATGGHYHGTYDGYGKVGTVDLDAEPCVWHKACWIVAEMPKTYVACDKADDATGFFEVDNDFIDLKEPKKWQ